MLLLALASSHEDMSFSPCISITVMCNSYDSFQMSFCSIKRVAFRKGFFVDPLQKIYSRENNFQMFVLDGLYVRR